MTHPFTDVPDGAYYADAVQWAYDNGVTTGATPTTFRPDAPVTRGQLVTMLMRYNAWRDQSFTYPPEPLPPDPQPEPPDPPARGPVWVPAFGGGEIGILIPDGFPHPDDYKGLPRRTFPADTREVQRLENLVLDLRGQDVPWAIGAVDNGRNFTVRNCLVLVDHADAIKAAHNVTIEQCCIISFGAALGAHVDCVQNSGGGSGVHARRSSFICRHQNSTNGWRAASNVGPISDCWVEDSFLFGGSYSADFDVRNHSITDSGLRRCVLAGKSTGVWRAGAGGVETDLKHYVRTEGGARAIDCTVLAESHWRVDR